MFNRILLPLDRSSLAECVLPHTIAVARAFESQVTLLNVMDVPREARWRNAMDPLNWQIRKAEAKTYLHEVDLRLQAAGLLTETHILEGFAAEQIIGFSDTHTPQLIILSSHGQSGLSGWNVSGVVLKVILRARTSIMIVRAYQLTPTEMTSLRYRRILVPIDGSQRAECVLPMASTLARFHEAQILLAHVVRRPEMPRRTPPSREDVEVADRLVERNRAEAIQYLNDLRSQLSGEVQARVLVSNHIAATLHELVEQEMIDLVVLSAHGHSGLTQWPYGSVVISFITFGTTPLLIVQDLSQDEIQPSPAEIAAKEPWKAITHGPSVLSVAQLFAGPRSSVSYSDAAVAVQIQAPIALQGG
ncbi:MAG TPA: universal stress protein [Anaerolineae bacterium]|nr:universal stress protein [Anaerolineae bacterium]